MSAKNKSKNDELRYYNVRKHEIVIIILMVVVFVGITLVMPWIIAAIDLLFRQIPGWGDLGADTTATFNIGVLPDFLGGAIGIIAGFIMEWQFFDKLKLLGKYNALVVLLLGEFDGIYREFSRQKVTEKLSPVKEFISDDIILNADNCAVIYNIHTFPWSKRGNIYKLLLNIYGHIEQFNVIASELVKQKNSGSKPDEEKKTRAKNLRDKIQEEIKSFFMVAGSDVNNYTGDKI